MATKRKTQFNDPEAPIGLPNAREWDVKKTASIKALLNERVTKRTPGQKLEIEIRSIQYRMEIYLNEDTKKYQSLEYFVQIFLSVLNLNFKTFAISIDTKDSNLKKYLTGERKFNKDLAMKFAKFFHTSPDLWLKIDLKNELTDLHKKHKELKKYEKYDYRKVVSV